MPPLYITTQGSKLRYLKRRLVVEKDSDRISAVPAVHVDQVLVFGNVSLTTPAISYLLEKGIDTVFLTVRGRFKGRLVGAAGGNGQLRLLQYHKASDPAWALETSRAIVTNKLRTTRTILLRYGRRLRAHPSSAERTVEVGSGGGNAIGDGSALRSAADEIVPLVGKAARACSVNTLNGVEGRGAAVYFGVFRRLVRAPGWNFTKRTRRPPRDPVNALLSFGYTVLAHNVESAVRATGLDPYLGFLHQVAYNRPSLALDIVEPFRLIVVDSVVLRCLNNRIILPSHFRFDQGGPQPVLLSDEGRELFVRELERRLNARFKHPESGDSVTYRRCFHLEARKMARCVQTGDGFRPFAVR